MKNKLLLICMMSLLSICTGNVFAQTSDSHKPIGEKTVLSRNPEFRKERICKDDTLYSSIIQYLKSARM